MALNAKNVVLEWPWREKRCLGVAMTRQTLLWSSHEATQPNNISLFVCPYFVCLYLVCLYFVCLYFVCLYFVCLYFVCLYFVDLYFVYQYFICLSDCLYIYA